MQQYQYNTLIQKLASYDYFVMDQKVEELYPELKRTLELKTVFRLSEPEQAKSFESFSSAVEFFLEKGITRQDTIIAIGGGATTDFGGFVAATILRGVSWKAVPTSLLGMIDAAIGGKVGINTPQGKNLLGAFHFPREVLICESFLSTLPEKELISGKGELLKYFFINSELSWSGEINSEILLACAKIKSEIVDKDFKEIGNRKILNLGHTIGHALEKAMDIPHGLAVAFGLKIKIDLYAKELKGDFDQLVKDLNLDLMVEGQCDFDQFESYLRQDKKRVNNSLVEIIMPKSLGVVDIFPIEMNQLIKDIKNYEHFKSYFK